MPRSGGCCGNAIRATRRTRRRPSSRCRSTGSSPSPPPTPRGRMAAASIPVKMGGVDGSQVEAYVAAGRLAEVADYCLSDVLATYCVFLRYEMVRGDLTPAHLETSMASLRATVQKHVERRPLLSAFLK